MKDKREIEPASTPPRLTVFQLILELSRDQPQWFRQIVVVVLLGMIVYAGIRLEHGFIQVLAGR